MAILYTLEVDLSRDGTYDDPNEDLSAYVLSMSFRYGMMATADAGWVSPASRYDGVTQPAHLEATLDNSVESGQLFMPDNLSSPYHGALTRGLLVRVRMIVDSVTATLWTGKLQKLVPTAGLAEAQTVTLVAEDQSSVLLDSNFSPELQTNVTTSAAIGQVFDAGLAPWPYDKGWWILGYSRLARDTVLFGSTNYVADTGYTTLPWVGDTSVRTSGGGTSALQYIRDVIVSEAGGRFFWNARTGQWNFHNRYHDALVTSITDTLSQPVGGVGDFDMAQVRNGDDLVTRVIIYYQPRAQGTPASILFSADNLPISLKAGTSTTLQMRYRDPSNPGVQMGGYNVITPLLGTDVTANAASDGSGADKTSAIGIGTTVSAQSTTIVISNPLKTDVWITALQVRGTPLRRFNQEAAEAHDASGRGHYDLQPLVINASQIGTLDTAQGVANHLLHRFNTPLTRYASVRLTANDSPRLRSLVQNAAVGQKFTINDSTTDHVADYSLIGEAHELTPTGSAADPWLHRATWLLKPAAVERVWLLGRQGASNLNTSTFLAF